MTEQSELFGTSTDHHGKTRFTQRNERTRQKRDIHANSKEAYKSIDATKRRLEVLNFIKHYGPVTVKQIQNGLGYPDRNCVAPRVSELQKPKYGMAIVAFDNVICETTNKKVDRFVMR